MRVGRARRPSGIWSRLVVTRICRQRKTVLVRVRSAQVLRTGERRADGVSSRLLLRGGGRGAGALPRGILRQPHRFTEGGGLRAVQPGAPRPSGDGPSRANRRRGNRRKRSRPLRTIHVAPAAVPRPVANVPRRGPESRATLRSAQVLLRRLGPAVSVGTLRARLLLHRIQSRAARYPAPNVAKASTGCSGTRPLHAAHLDEPVTRLGTAQATRPRRTRPARPRSTSRRPSADGARRGATARSRRASPFPVCSRRLSRVRAHRRAKTRS